jgi:hypothetical protein
MAAGKIPAIGHHLGPCKESCHHTDCAGLRRMAESYCRLCNEPIGYDRYFYIDPQQPKTGDKAYIHAICLEKENDNGWPYEAAIR